jgi:hypothetical protein
VALCVALGLTVAAGSAGVAPSAASPQAATAPELVNLDPGGRVALHQEIPVTIVYVGLEPGAGATGIDAARIEDFQPESYEPVNRTEADRAKAKLGLRYTYTYRSVFAGPAFEDAFFAHLGSIAKGPGAPTIYQAAYSAQPLAAKQITENWTIDGPAAEAWLATHAGPMLGVDTARPTVFMVSWFGRADFRFHTYTSSHVVPGNDLSSGQARERDHVTAFGGSTTDDPQNPAPQLARVWFYDTSAGPDYAGAGWELTTTELDPYYWHDGIPDHRIPPVWEYGTTHWYRPFDDLSGDVARVVRFIAVNLLFTSSPVYSPALSPPLLVDDIQLNLVVVGGDPAVDPLERLHPEAINAAFSRMDPSRRFTNQVKVVPFDAGAREGFSCAGSGARFWIYTTSCYDIAADPVLDADRFADTRRKTYLDGMRYELPMLLFEVPNRMLGGIGWAGLAHSSQYGPQRWAVGIVAPRIRKALLQPANLMTHESGHHVGFSHPHDGYDSELDINYGPYNETYFTMIGDAVNSVMSYHNMTEEFGQFNRDDMDRWMTATRLQWANRILADIYASPRAGDAAAQLEAADDRAGVAADLLADWDLRGASLAARDAYGLVREAATIARVAIEPWNGRQDQGQLGFNAWTQNPVLSSGQSAAASTDHGGRRPPMPDPAPLRPEPPGVVATADLADQPFMCIVPRLGAAGR